MKKLFKIIMVLLMCMVNPVHALEINDKDVIIIDGDNQHEIFEIDETRYCSADQTRVTNPCQSSINNLAIVVAGGRAAGYEYAADFLAASINQNTKTLRYTLGSDLSEKVEQDRLYEQAYEDMIKILDETSKVNKKTISGELEGSYRFKTGDLYLALNKVDIDYSATYDGEWVVTLRFSDTYNFEHNNWAGYGSSLGSAAVSALNNYAATAMSMGCLSEYEVEVFVRFTY